MKIEQIYTHCLSQCAYYIESAGECAIIDPLRDTTPYLERARRDKGAMMYIFETHLHEDFVSGHLDLSRQTGAEIVLGPHAAPDFEATIAEDGRIFPLGEVSIVALYTPGHAIESTCYLLRDEWNINVALFTGDTLLIDYASLAFSHAEKAGKDHGAQNFYHSLHKKIMPLADNVIIYPGHYRAEAKPADIVSDTLEHLKESNITLEANLTLKEFIEMSDRDGFNAIPYLEQIVNLNKGKPEDFRKVLLRGLHGLNTSAFAALAQDIGALILDTRDAHQFVQGFIPGALNISLDNHFPMWAARLIDSHQEILLITDPGREIEAITQLAYVGLDYCFGYLFGGMKEWAGKGKPVDVIRSVMPGELESATMKDVATIIDARGKDEYNAGHLENAINLPLGIAAAELPPIEKTRPVYVYCSSGNEAITFISKLRGNGYRNLIAVNGGYGALQASALFKIVTEADMQPLPG